MNDRKHLTSHEIEKVIAATKSSRNKARESCLLLLIFRQGLRISEALGLKLSQVSITRNLLAHAIFPTKHD